MTVQRFTLFKIPKEEDLPYMIEQYKTLQANAVKNGKPYVLSLHAGPTMPDPRSAGHTLAVRTTFASLEDMRYYDNECAAHKAFRAATASKREGNVLTVYFEDVIGAAKE